MNPKKIRCLISGEEAASAVEFAIILPLLILILFGIIEFGLLLYNKQMITNAAREGARAGIVARTPRLSDDEVKTVVNDYLSPGGQSRLIDFGTATPVVTVTRTDVNGDGSLVGFGDDLSVLVTFNYSFLVLTNLGFGPVNIGSTAVMKME
jgi:Flp pilus assembly protein TadG